MHYTAPPRCSSAPPAALPSLPTLRQPRRSGSFGQSQVAPSGHRLLWPSLPSCCTTERSLYMALLGHRGFLRAGGSRGRLGGLLRGLRKRNLGGRGKGHLGGGGGSSLCSQPWRGKDVLVKTVSGRLGDTRLLIVCPLPADYGQLAYSFCIG